MSKKLKETFMNIKKNIDELSKKIGVGKYYKLNMISSSVAFYLVWTAVPIIYLLIEFTKFFRINVFQDVFKLFYENLPLEIQSILKYTFDIEAFSQTTTSIVFIVVLIFTVSKITRIIITSSHLVYTSELKDFVGMRYILGLVVTFVLTTLFVLMFLVYSGAIALLNYIETYTFIDINKLVDFFEFSIFPLTFFMLYLITYTLTNPVSKKIKNNYAGAIFTCLTTAVVTEFFINNFTYFTNDLVYGTLSGVVLFFIWLYSCCYCFTIGLSLNAYLFKMKEQ